MSKNFLNEHKIMKPTNAALNAVLASGEFIRVDAYIFTLIDGTILRYISGDADIIYGGHTYSAGGINGAIINNGQKTQLHWKTGLDVDTLIFDIAPRGATVEGIPFFQAIHQGFFDGADLTLGRFYMSTYGNISPGLLTVFQGRIGNIDMGRIKATFTINSYTELFNMQLPRNTYQPPCLNTLYDTACTLNQASFATTGSVSSGSTVISINATLSQATGYFALGKIKFTSGTNNGLQRGVKTYTNGSPSVITLSIPLGTAPSASDTFTIYAGCDKQQSTCTNKFSNLVNFRGQPYIPENSTAV